PAAAAPIVVSPVRVPLALRALRRACAHPWGSRAVARLPPPSAVLPSAFARVFSRQGVAGEHKRPVPRARVPSIYPSPCRFAPLTPPRAPAAGPSFRNIHAANRPLVFGEGE